MANTFEPPAAQRGVSDRPRQHLILAALTFRSDDAASCRAAVDGLRTLISHELDSQIADAIVETGELGYDKHHDDRGLRVTLALSSDGYARLAVPAELRPIDLHPIPSDVTNPADPASGPEIGGEGDLLLHIASDDPFVAEHVLRRVQHELGGQLGLTWVQTGVQRFTLPQKGSRQDQRALIGFLDGIANLHMSDPADRGLVFVNHTRSDYPPNPQPATYGGASFPTLRDVPTGAEPVACDGGSYMAVEVLTLNIAFWDSQAISDQERMVGRTKVDGIAAPNAGPTSHTLKANPHRAGTDDDLRRFLRRGYPLIRPLEAGLGLGLVFIGFARSLTTQLEFVRRAWINNPDFPTIGAGQDALLFGGAVNTRLLVGGYYFVPPLEKAADLTSWVIPAASQT